MNIAKKQKTDSQLENRLLAVKWKEVGRGKYWKFGIRRCELLDMNKMDKHKVLLHSTRDYIQYPVCNKP